VDGVVAGLADHEGFTPFPGHELCPRGLWPSRLSEVGQAYRRVIGRHFPTMTLVQVVALVEDRAKVEIQAMAVVPN